MADAIDLLSRLLTPVELQELAEALLAVHEYSGWGSVQLELKGGRVDKVSQSMTRVVREKPAIERRAA